MTMTDAATAPATWGDLSGKVAVVTGGSRGLGRDMARALLDGGASVAITGRDVASLEHARDALGHEVLAVAGDASNETDVAACLDAVMGRFGRIDIMVNNAGTSARDSRLVELELDDFDWMWSLNVRGPLLWVRGCWERWMGDHGGVVINVSSAGGISTTPGMGAYGASKAALNHLTKSLAAELGPQVRVNAIAPGLVRSYGTAQVIDALGETIAPALPLERLGRPSDVSELVRFLASDLSGWMTGEILVVDGGTQCAGGKQVGFRTRAGIPGGKVEFVEFDPLVNDPAGSDVR